MAKFVLDARIKVWSSHPRLLEEMRKLGLPSGPSGREYLMQKAGPDLKEGLGSITREIQRKILDLYEQPLEGRRYPMRFTGGYGRSVRIYYRAQTAQVWPWAYVGLYPIPGGSTPISQIPWIYISSVEGGAGPSAAIRPSPEMISRLTYWVRERTGLEYSTKQGRAYVQSLALQLLQRGTMTYQLFERVKTDPRFAADINWELEQLLNRVVGKIAGRY